jgi:hypothetical protein
MNWHRKTQDMAIGEAELATLTTDMVDAHEATLPVLKSSIADWGEEIVPLSVDDNSGFNRRAFLARTGLLAVGGVALATSGAGASVIPRLVRSGGDVHGEGLHSASSVPIDVEIAALAASLENLAVATYSSALSAAKAGKLGAVPSAVATFVTTARKQHADHSAAWNALVSSAGYDKITAPNAALAKTVDAAFAKVTDVPGVAKLALTLEDAAAATYLEAIGVVTGTRAIATAATIQPVEMQHAAILHFVLGQYPVPLAFATTAGAATLADKPPISKR